MKWLLVLVFVAISCAFGGHKSIKIGEDRTIDIINFDGKHIVITKTPGDKFIDILVEGPNLPTKTLRINEKGTEKNVDMQNELNSLLTDEEYENDYFREKRTSKDFAFKDTTKSKSQGDLLGSIFKKHAGIVDEKSYESLIKKVEEHVKTGALDPTILVVLKYLHNVSTENANQNLDIHKFLRRTSTLRDYILSKYQEPGLYGNVKTELG